MSRDVYISIRPDVGNQVRLVVETGPAISQHLDRQQHGIPDGDLDQLRNGAPPAAVRDSVVTAVTTWFLGNDLPLALTPVLSTPTRLLISTDHKIEAAFANVPFELTRWNADYLLLTPNLTGLVYAPTTIATPLAPAAQNATFRVLLIRAEPNSYAGTVPAGITLRDKLRAAVPVILEKDVKVRLLSREPGSDGPATIAGILTEVSQHPPSVVLYLGHGDLLPGAGGPPSPVLLVERADGEQDELLAAGLRQMFLTQPVPLVVLASCLTGAAGMTVNGDSSKFARSLAQFLVAGEGGVGVAIGMRYKVDIQAATRFLEKLINSLLGAQAGNVDLAVKSARNELFIQQPNDLAWAAAAVYRRVLSEPLFPELHAQDGAPPPVITTTPEDEAARRQLSAMWSALAKQPAHQPAFVEAIRVLSDTIEQDWRQRCGQKGAVGLVPRVDALVAAPGQKCKVRIELTSVLLMRELKLDLVVRGAVDCDVLPSPVALKTLGVKRLHDDSDPSVVTLEFRCDQEVKLPAGLLCEVEVTLGTDDPSVVELSFSGISCTPQKTIVGWVAAIAVRAN